MRKALSFIVVFCLLICLCGCGANFETTVTVNEPTDNSVNGYRLGQQELITGEQSEVIESTVNITGESVYYANKNSKKFHISSCGTAKRINEENLYITSDRNELINSGYSPCKSCNP